ncbi:alpha-ketoglutarate-dependent dioxygenase AlkB family protein [Streptomyces sp. NPDC001678]|uniref:alpha-ketoglutarate-dependent dioxygenase AlkB family protein n=1 Tax=Streptomyces sp. NPDC001678 TaxID=3364599 RepID=UPI0036AE1A39
MDGELFPRPVTEVAPGAVHVPGWLDEAAQHRLLAACREWARPPAGGRTVRMPSGGEMSVRTVCLGRHWFPYGYARTVVDGDGAPVKPFPRWLDELARAAVARVYGRPAGPERYDIALVNFYDADAKMGLHRDADEKSAAPVVSLSLGDSCVFRFGHPGGRTRPWADVELRSGDLFVFGGPARPAYHGVPRILPGTAPPGLGLKGRLNITLRVSGL